MKVFTNTYITLSNLASFFGALSSICFTFVYLPQLFLNFSRHSVQGLSLSSIVLRLFGSVFLCENSLFNNSPSSIFYYGLTNTIEHSLMLIQYANYTKKYIYIFFLFVPFLPLLIYYISPNLLSLTDYVKPITQVIGFIPQLICCIQQGSTLSISLISQHFHYLGSLFGFTMLILSNEYHVRKWILYGNTFIEAYSFYILSAWYGEFRFLDKSQEIKDDKTIPLSVDQNAEEKSEDPTFRGINDDHQHLSFKITE